MKNNKKKKILVIALLLFAIIGVAGYGVYSYYWTQGSFGTSSSGSNAVYLNGSFNPHTSDNGSYILGYGGSIELTCSEPDSNKEVTCTGSTTIVNDGSTAVDVEVLNPTYYGYNYVSNNYTPTFNWTSKRIEAGSSAELTVTAVSTLEDGETESSAEYVDSPVTITPTMGVEFSLKATQVH